MHFISASQYDFAFSMLQTISIGTAWEYIHLRAQELCYKKKVQFCI